MNKIMILKDKDHKVSRWSGGTTTQLFIYPPGADYHKRNFLFRISTATVEVERSDFTSLPGFKRKLMVLEGNIVIRHKDHYSKTLKKFEQDEFDGGWETSAQGKVTDFNLMMGKGVEGKIEAIALQEGEQAKIGGKDRTFVYVYKGEIMIEGQRACTSDFVSFEEPQKLAVTAVQKAELIIASVKILRAS